MGTSLVTHQASTAYLCNLERSGKVDLRYLAKHVLAEDAQKLLHVGSPRRLATFLRIAKPFEMNIGDPGTLKGS